MKPEKASPAGATDPLPRPRHLPYMGKLRQCVKLGPSWRMSYHFIRHEMKLPLYTRLWDRLYHYTSWQAEHYLALKTEWCSLSVVTHLLRRVLLRTSFCIRSASVILNSNYAKKPQSCPPCSPTHQTPPPFPPFPPSPPWLSSPGLGLYLAAAFFFSIVNGEHQLERNLLIKEEDAPQPQR